MSHLAPDSDSKTIHGTFRLLVPKTAEHPIDARSIELDGVAWVLVEHARIPSASEKPDFVCLSYSWGRGRALNPFDRDRPMSDRTISALESTVKALRPVAIWVDALCVPSSEEARAACLRSMGAIYSAAARVVVVLTASCAELLEQIHLERQIDPASILVLEHEDWVSRAWTYQEIVNSRSAQFLAEGSVGASVSGNDLLRVTTSAISDYKKQKGLSSFRFRSLFPRLDAFESLIADYMTADFLERSAIQVMAAIDRRSSERAEDYFNAMIGAITTESPALADLSLHPAEYFMRICEAKGDYSFIYSTAPRDEAPGRGWRPVAGRMPVVVTWYGHSERQTACQHPTHLQLNNMCQMLPGSIDSDGRSLIDWWLETDTSTCSSGEVAALILERLREAGFTGCGEHLELEHGYFFPQAPLVHRREVVAVSAEVAWIHGAPALVLSGDETGMRRFVGVGVFVGRVPKVGQPLDIV